MSEAFRGNSLLFQQPEMFPDLPALAERLGVQKLCGRRASIVLTMKNGDSYSLFEIANAFLDRMGAAAGALDNPSQITPDVAGS